MHSVDSCAALHLMGFASCAGKKKHQELGCTHAWQPGQIFQIGEEVRRLSTRMAPGAYSMHTKQPLDVKLTLSHRPRIAPKSASRLQEKREASSRPRLACSSNRSLHSTYPLTSPSVSSCFSTYLLNVQILPVSWMSLSQPRSLIVCWRFPQPWTLFVLFVSLLWFHFHTFSTIMPISLSVGSQTSRCFSKFLHTSSLFSENFELIAKVPPISEAVGELDRHNLVRLHFVFPSLVIVDRVPSLFWVSFALFCHEVFRSPLTQQASRTIFAFSIHLLSFDV